MSKRILTVPGVAVAAGLIAASLGPATAHADTTTAADVYFAATLLGENEVPTDGGPAVGDRNGEAVGVFRIHGNKMSYAIRWDGVAAPTAFHIHQGKAGRNGDVKIGFFGEALPGGLRAVTGTVKVGDSGLLAGIRKNPKNWYANLHTGEFPGGAVRAQLHRIRPVHLSSVLAAGVKASIKSDANGRQEVPAPGQKVGDRDGRAEWLFRVSGGKLYYATIWDRIGAPTNGHIHRGKKGKNGPVVVDFFADANGLPKSISGVAGVAPVKRAIGKGIKANPKNWYSNLHTGEFPGGAVRGQLRGAHGGW
ncbi:CHRD domain-containing protein [Streptosporangium sp. KLBMP 9127]|nr:CHRD domain-containing protein [Streptosporangium sp. KLBMP 9127]